MNDKSTSVLLVEDDTRLAEFVVKYLVKNGFTVHHEERGGAAVERIQSLEPDLVILDIGLPGRDGLEVCREVRPFYSGPIIVLTARGEEVDEIVGLEVGADDYLIKPLRPKVLLARIRSALRRERKRGGSVFGISVVRAGGLEIETKTRTALLSGVELDLSTSEYEVLLTLARQKGRIVARDDIFRQSHGREYDGIDRSVDICVSKLRKMLGDNPRKPKILKTVHGVGYILVDSG
ncbi:MAG: response regulator transcription factor [Deltaproteobacteria bacterium]|nr:response regulator transcription factor [Deltaproteobacteria bacterium]